MNRLVFLATIPFGVLGLVMTFFLKEVSQYLSDEVVFGLKYEEATDYTQEEEKGTNTEELETVPKA